MQIQIAATIIQFLYTRFSIHIHMQIRPPPPRTRNTTPPTLAQTTTKIQQNYCYTHLKILYILTRQREYGFYKHETDTDIYTNRCIFPRGHPTMQADTQIQTHLHTYTHTYSHLFVLLGILQTHKHTYTHRQTNTHTCATCMHIFFDTNTSYTRHTRISVHNVCKYE